eukprot:TRINITY_DN4238_c0_g1_i5.p1 TRINITY_DN4238_c0_g1~~TRINITY_DN4238_c0_g1_i5.p1  ORF type:complete len:309 (-),score=65.04 TRINITY_DN4238_c0_g1_i5:208-1134(-)
MPVTGFPATLERTLTALMVDNAISSWKVAGEGDNTTVVLRLKPVSTPATTTTNMAGPVLNRSTQIQYFRRKPPSQIRRDQERARQQRQASEQQQRKTSESQHRDCAVDANNMTDSEPEQPATQYTTTTHADQLASEEEQQVKADGLHALDIFEHSLSRDTDSDCILSRQLSDTMEHEETIDRSVGGFNTGVVKGYVATLTDKSVQRRLRDRTRNKSFRKVVLHHADSEDLLICESEDLVLEYRCSPDTTCHHYWYIKQEEHSMLTEERAKLANLWRGEHASRSQHADLQARAARNLDTLHGLILFYLG